MVCQRFKIFPEIITNGKTIINKDQLIKYLFSIKKVKKNLQKCLDQIKGHPVTYQVITDNNTKFNEFNEFINE